MKKGFIAFVKALLGVAKVVLAILGVLVLAVVASLLLSIPGGKRFSRYCSYPDMKALVDAERDDIVATVAYERGGTNYTFVVLKPCRFLASGCAVLVYDPEGRLIDKTGDEGDDGCSDARPRREAGAVSPSLPKRRRAQQGRPSEELLVPDGREGALVACAVL